MGRLKNKVAIVSGGANGIGRLFALDLLKKAREL